MATTLVEAWSGMRLVSTVGMRTLRRAAPPTSRLGEEGRPGGGPAAAGGLAPRPDRPPVARLRARAGPAADALPRTAPPADRRPRPRTPAGSAVQTADAAHIAEAPPVDNVFAPPPVLDEEPPEETSDPAVAQLVAGLEDEVVVVDEQPRYHTPGCRGLVAKAVIPLPVREAVELGFTPCSWCTPNRKLANQHPAAARWYRGRHPPDPPE